MGCLSGQGTGNGRVGSRRGGGAQRGKGFFTLLHKSANAEGCACAALRSPERLDRWRVPRNMLPVLKQNWGKKILLV
jgi:hypothetical protein